MTIIEALKSGKRFKRKYWPKSSWYASDLSIITLTIADILTDDWEIEESHSSITREQLRAALQKPLGFGDNWFNNVCEELGLE